MGTFFSGQTKAELVEELKKTNFMGGAIVLESSLRGNELWLLCGKKDEPSGWFIQLALLSKSGEEWGYKPMSESMGPYYYRCPLKFLKAAPVKSPEWRLKVVAHTVRS